MKLTIIGFWGGYPAPNEATSSYLLEKDGFSLVIDMGSGSLAKIQNYKHVLDIDAVILSHYHHDHVADIGVLQYARLVQSYITDQKDILPIYGHQEDELAFQSLSHDYTEGVAYDPLQSLKIGPFTIAFLKTNHGVPCYGMRISDGDSVFVYTADTAYQDEWIEFARDADMIITDCNFYANQDGSEAGHMSSRDGATIAQKANVKELILSHLPQYGEHEQLVKEAREYFSGTIYLAHEGLSWSK